MSKYYVTCGTHQLLITAECAEQAAMRMMDELMSPHAWIYDDAELSEQTRRDHLVLEALLHLQPEVIVSERGFGRDEAGQYGTPELIDRWHKLMTGLSRLFVAAGLVPRKFSAAWQASTIEHPNHPR